MAVVHQILPTLEYGDAISNYAVLLHRVLRDMGHESRIYARFVDPKMRRWTWPFREVSRLAPNRTVIWVYHYSIASEITQMVREFSGPLVLIYHNVTPPTLALAADRVAAARYFAGQDDLKTLVDLPCVAAGDSQYNRAHLEETGFRHTEVLPIILDLSQFDRSPNRSIVKRYSDGGVNFLTVGRVFPHKKIEDVIRVFGYYQKHINSRSRLFVVGDPKGMEAYQEHLLWLWRTLGLSDVHFTGKVRFRHLLSYYRIADVYLCMSEHEGFCVPLLECMHLGVPIIAYKCAAVGETMGDAGVLVREKRFDEIAEMAHLLVTDKDLRARVIAKQKERSLFFSKEHFTGQLQRILALAQGSA